MVTTENKLQEYNLTIKASLYGGYVMDKKYKFSYRIMKTIIVISSILMLSGCYKYKRELDFNVNGSVTVKIEMIAKEELIKTQYTSVDDFYAEAEKAVEQGKYRNFEYEKTKTTLDGADAYGIVLKGTVPERLAAGYVANDDFNVEIYKSGFIDKTITVYLNGDSSIEKTEENSYAEYLKNSSSNEFVIRVPWKITSTNGFKDENDSKKVTWDVSDIESGKVSSKELIVSYTDYTIIIAVGVAFVIVVAIVVLLIVLIGKKKGNRGGRMMSVSI